MMKSFLEYLAEATQGNQPKIKLVAIQGSPRTIDSCSGGDSKTSFLLEKAIDSLPKDIKVDLIDLKVMDTDPQVRPCKGCIGTSNGFHCHFPCDCYDKDDGTDDLMHQENVYERMQKADGFVVFTPVHWYGPSSQVKAFFDRLVCVNLTLTREDAKRIYGKDIKDPKKTIAAEKSGEYRNLLKNHFEGKFGAFFIHGDDGANDYNNGKIPLSMAQYKTQDYMSPKEAIMPIVNQCRYSGIFVHEDCIHGQVFGYKKPYSQNNIDVKKSEMIENAAKLVNCLVDQIRKSKLN